MAKSYCKLDKKGMEFNFDGCVYPDSICSKCRYWIPEGKEIKEKIDKSAIRKAKEAAQNNFNSMPFEVRKKLANGYERLLEVELLLSKGDKLSLADIKKRKRELEQWLLEWYKENKI